MDQGGGPTGMAVRRVKMFDRLSPLFLTSSRSQLCSTIIPHSQARLSHQNPSLLPPPPFIFFSFRSTLSSATNPPSNPFRSSEPKARISIHIARVRSNGFYTNQKKNKLRSADSKPLCQAGDLRRGTIFVKISRARVTYLTTTKNPLPSPPRGGSVVAHLYTAGIELCGFRDGRMPTGAMEMEVERFLFARTDGSWEGARSHGIRLHMLGLALGFRGGTTQLLQRIFSSARVPQVNLCPCMLELRAHLCMYAGARARTTLLGRAAADAFLVGAERAGVVAGVEHVAVAAAPVVHPGWDLGLAGWVGGGWLSMYRRLEICRAGGR